MVIAPTSDNSLQMNFDAGRFFKTLDEAITKKRLDLALLWRVYNLSDSLEKIVGEMDINPSEIESAEELVIRLDDMIDDLETRIKKSSLLSSFLLRRIRDRLLTIQFIISNKTADLYLEDHQDRSV